MLRRKQTHPNFTLEPLPDGLSKRGLFAEPIRVTRFTASHEIYERDRIRVSFLVEIRDATERRCSDVFVEALVSSPERSRVVSGTTDLLGRIRFRIAGLNGAYNASITNVGAFGLQWGDDPELMSLIYDTTAKVDDE